MIKLVKENLFKKIPVKKIYGYGKFFLKFFYFSLLNLLKNNDRKKPTILVNLEKKNTANSRDLYTTLNAFSMADYNLIYIRKIRFKEFVKLDPYVRLIYSIKSLKIVSKFPTVINDIIYISDTKNKIYFNKNWKKVIYVKYDISSDFNKMGIPIFMPFPMHPLIYKLNLYKNVDEFRSSERRIKIFFSGAIYHKWYYELAHLVKNLMIRPEVIDTIMGELEDQKIQIINNKNFNDIFLNDYTNKCIIIDSDKYSINIKDWLNSLSKSDFFLCPPGDWPMCHNIVEAMAVGTIPITNYPNWLKPPLKDMENCISFTTKKDLIEKIKFVLDMDQEKITKMRKNVISYYEKHYNPINFINNIMCREEYYLTLIIIAVGEKFYKCYLPKINKKSIIVQ